MTCPVCGEPVDPEELGELVDVESGVATYDAAVVETPDGPAHVRCVPQRCSRCGGSAEPHATGERGALFRCCGVTWIPLVSRPAGLGSGAPGVLPRALERPRAAGTAED